MQPLALEETITLILVTLLLFHITFGMETTSPLLDGILMTLRYEPTVVPFFPSLHSSLFLHQSGVNHLSRLGMDGVATTLEMPLSCCTEPVVMGETQFKNHPFTTILVRPALSFLGLTN